MESGSPLRQRSFNETKPRLEVPNAKFFAIGDVYYHFSQFGESKINPYLGVGQIVTSTSISQSTSKGYAILPALKAGFQTEFAENNTFIEGVIESVSSTEIFESGTEQKTSTSTPKRPKVSVLIKWSKEKPYLRRPFL